MVTKTDIARALGVSHTCVSQVLNNTPNARISENTRKRVLRQARIMGYRPPARKRRAAGSSTICYIVCDVRRSDVWYLGVLQALQACALQDHRQIQYMTVFSDLPSLSDSLSLIDREPPLGIVVDGQVSDALVEEIRRRQIPLVVSGSTPYAHDPQRVGQVNAVSVDARGVVRQLMQWFHTRGARRISLTVGPLTQLVNSLVFGAYRDYLTDLGLEYDPALVQIGEETSGAEIIHRLGELGVDYDAILIGSRGRALRALPYLRSAERGSREKRLVGAFVPLDGADDLLGPVMISGPRFADVGKAIYQTLAAEINYSAARKRTIIVPCGMRHVEGLTVSSLNDRVRAVRSE